MKILFVCTGNICRSPTAEGVFRKHIIDKSMEKKFVVDSAGTHRYHVGESPDMRAVSAAKRRGVDISALRARQIGERDFDYFDLMLAMDRSHLQALTRTKPRESKAKMALFLEYAGVGDAQDVPDPYYGEPADFDYALDLIEQGVRGIMEQIVSHA